MCSVNWNLTASKAKKSCQVCCVCDCCNCIQRERSIYVKRISVHLAVCLACADVRLPTPLSNRLQNCMTASFARHRILDVKHTSDSRCSRRIQSFNVCHHMCMGVLTVLCQSAISTVISCYKTVTQTHRFYSLSIGSK